mgnify:CR=1 FL=1
MSTTVCKALGATDAIFDFPIIPSFDGGLGSGELRNLTKLACRRQDSCGKDVLALSELLYVR